MIVIDKMIVTGALLQFRQNPFGFTHDQVNTKHAESAYLRLCCTRPHDGNAIGIGVCCCVTTRLLHNHVTTSPAQHTAYCTSQKHTAQSSKTGRADLIVRREGR